MDVEAIVGSTGWGDINHIRERIAAPNKIPIKKFTAFVFFLFFKGMLKRDDRGFASSHLCLFFL